MDRARSTTSATRCRRRTSTAWNQYRDANGDPIYLQRPILVGEIITRVFGGRPSGRFHGKMIMLASTLDVQAFPWGADWYHQQALAEQGITLAENYRLWYMDNADHAPPVTPSKRPQREVPP